jgi:hypothetical protein
MAKKMAGIDAKKDSTAWKKNRETINAFAKRSEAGARRIAAMIDRDEFDAAAAAPAAVFPKSVKKNHHVPPDNAKRALIRMKNALAGQLTPAQQAASRDMNHLMCVAINLNMTSKRLNPNSQEIPAWTQAMKDAYEDPNNEMANCLDTVRFNAADGSVDWEKSGYFERTAPKVFHCKKSNQTRQIQADPPAGALIAEAWDFERAALTWETNGAETRIVLKDLF